MDVVPHGPGMPRFPIVIVLVLTLTSFTDLDSASQTAERGTAEGGTAAPFAFADSLVIKRSSPQNPAGHDADQAALIKDSGALFGAQGLLLPDLEVRFYDEAESCGGHLGILTAHNFHRPSRSAVTWTGFWSTNWLMRGSLHMWMKS